MFPCLPVSLNIGSELCDETVMTDRWYCGFPDYAGSVTCSGMIMITC